jgi:hypothetical protein
VNRLRTWLAGRDPGPARTYAEALAATTLAHAYAIDRAPGHVLAYATTLTASRFPHD